MKTLRDVWNKLAAKLARKQPSMLPDGQPTDGELNDRVNRASMIGQLMDHPGFEVWRDRVLQSVSTGKDNLLSLPADEFQGPKGLELKGICRGKQDALNEVRFILEEGIDAEVTLAERRKKQNAERSERYQTVQ